MRRLLAGILLLGGCAAPVAPVDPLSGCEKAEGFLTFWRSPEHLYVQVPEALLGKEMGFAAERLSGMGDGALRGGGLGNAVVSWERQGNRLVLKKRNLQFRAEGDPVLARAVRDSFPDSPVLSLPLSTGAPSGTLLAELKDLQGLAQVLPSGSGYASAPEENWVSAAKAFPDNVVLRVASRFVKKEEKPSPAGRLADARAFETALSYHFYRLPGSGFRPRWADERIGGFSAPYKDYALMGSRPSAFRYPLERWDLSKPLTFYIDRGTPQSVRPWIREAALEWNRAFRSAGAGEPLRVEDQPDDPSWDPEDLRHGMIYWCLTDSLRFSGMAGPSFTDPRTGEVLKAHVYLNAEFLEYARHRYQVYSWWRQPAPGRCDLAPSLSSQMAFARLVLEARGALKPGSPEAGEYVRQAFHLLVVHEMGHALGLGHNWKASLLSSWKDLEAGRCSGRDDGRIFSASVMDYNPIYLAPKGVTQQDYYLRELGPYDKLAIEFLYRPTDSLTPEEEAKALDAIAARAETAPGLAYDDGSLGGIDPGASSDDLGDDPLSFAESRLAMLQDEVLPGFPDRILAEGNDYAVLGRAMDTVVFSVAMDYADLLARHVGGRKVLKRLAGSAAAPKGGPEPLTPVPPDDQRRALGILEKRIFRPEAFSLPPEARAKFKPETLGDWNFPWRGGADYFPEQRIAGLYESVLSTLLEGSRLARVMDNERLSPKDAVTLPELFGRLEAMAFSGGPDSQGRRAFQRILVQGFVTLALAPPAGTPAEASQIARARLGSVAERLKAVDAKADGYAKAHVADLSERIRRALTATTQVAP